MRYERRAELGRGATGVVYRAFDRELQQEIALKTLRGVPAERDQQLKFEFRILRDLAHPNLVQLYDLVIDDREAFFTMELVEGVDLLRFVRGDCAPRQALDDAGVQRLRGAFGQLAAGLAALHDGGRVHRDLKPANVLVTADGRLRLLDFGLAAARDDDDPVIAGTLPYMAPEQIWGMPPTPAMDWYAFGVLLWEALTGVTCFAGSAASILRAKEHGPIPNVRDHVPATDVGVVGLVRLLLDSDPRRRPAADTVRAVLEGRAPPPAAAPAPPAEVYVGRTAELATLAEWLAAVPVDGPRVGHVVGPSGIGKTALGQRFTRLAAPALVLWSRCRPEERVPFQALDGVIDGLARHLRRQPQAPDAGCDWPALVDVFPALAGVAPAPAGPPAELDARERRRRAFAALRALLGGLARRQPLAIWIDDAQWGDRDSAQALVEVLAGGQAPPLLLVLAHRSEEAASAAFVHDLARAGLEPAACLELRPLPAEQARALAAQLLARDDADRLIGWVVAESAGSPFLVEQLSVSLRAAGDAPGTLPPAAAVLGQIDRLGADARTLAELVSVAGGALDLVDLLPLVAVADAVPLVYRLREQRVLRTRATRPRSVEIYHDRIREALIAALPAARRAALHRAVATVLRARPATSPEALLEHLLGAGDRATAAPVALAAAEHNLAALAFGRAAELFELAVDLRAAGDADWRLLARRGEALANAGRGAEAGHVLIAAAEAAARTAAAPADVLALRAAAARELLCAGEYRPGTQALAAMLAAAGLSYPRTPAAAAGRLLFARARIAARGLQFTPRPAAALEAAALARIDACWAATIGLNAFDAVRSAAFQARHTLLALDAGEPVRAARALTAEAVYRAAEGGRGGRARAGALMARVERLADELGDPRTRGFARLCAGVGSYFAARWPDAVAQLDEAERIFRGLHGVGWELNNCVAYRLWSLAWMGDVDRLRDEQRAAHAEARSRDDALAAIGCASGHANLAWLLTGRPDEARANAAAAIAAFPTDSFQSPHYADLLARVRVDLYAGDVWAAWQQLHDTLPRLRRILLLRLQLFRIEVWATYAAAALAAAAAGAPPPRLTGWHRRRLLAEAARATRRLRAEDLPAAGALAEALAAAAAGLEGAAGEAERFRHVAAALDSHGLGLYAGAARWRAGAGTWPGVRDPARLAAVLLPGGTA